MPSGSYDAVDAYIEGQMRRLKMPGVSLAIVEGDQIVHLRGFGRARPGGEAPTPATPFFVGSLAKSFTALAVMQLVEAGKIELDAPVQRYLPWFRVADPQASAEMTVRHLLNQTSGLPESCGETALANFDDHPGATERQVRLLAPGARAPSEWWTHRVEASPASTRAQSDDRPDPQIRIGQEARLPAALHA
jgi:CubicO group peptidase (beta-lactamase class C family)